MSKHYLSLPNGDVAVYDDKGRGYRNPYLHTIKNPTESAAKAREAYHAAVVAYAEAVVDPNATDDAIIAAFDAAAAAASAAWAAADAVRATDATLTAEYAAWTTARAAARDADAADADAARAAALVSE